MPTYENVDLLVPGQGGQGPLAAEIVANGRLDPGAYRPFTDEKGRSYVQVYIGGDPSKKESYRVSRLNVNATLRRDEWKQLDDALLPIAEIRLGGVQDLVDAGLVFNIGNGMGATVFEWHDSGDALDAELTMDAVTRAKGDRITFQHNYLPLPIIHVDYEINERILQSSRRMGAALDTLMVERAGRKVREKIEEMVFTNTSYAYGTADSRSRNTIYSLVNHPDRNQVSLTVGWDDSSTTPERIKADVLAMKQASIDAKFYGPWALYLPTDCETALDDDYYTAGPTRNASSTTVRERIEKIDGIKKVRIIDKMATDNYLLVQLTTDVVRLIQGMPIQNIQWATEGGIVHKFKVMAIQVPQVRSDRNGACGVTHMA